MRERVPSGGDGARLADAHESGALRKLGVTFFGDRGKRAV